MSHRILLVDDEVDILEFVRYNLVREGYEVFTAENGAEALKVAAECRPHLILLDMMMPVMDGAQTCRAIREDPQLRDTMVVFLSALGEEEQQLAGFGVGAKGGLQTIQGCFVAGSLRGGLFGCTAVQRCQTGSVCAAGKLLLPCGNRFHHRIILLLSGLELQCRAAYRMLCTLLSLSYKIRTEKTMCYCCI